jgi:hypothetical protein
MVSCKRRLDWTIRSERTPTATHTLHALAKIDPVTNWFEVTDIADKMQVLSWKHLITRG